MRVASYIALGLGFFLIAGTAGSSDFYEECRAAADCVAGEPMSGYQILFQLVAGVVLMTGGVLGLIVED